MQRVDFQLCASVDSKDVTLLDEEKIEYIRKLEATKQYIFNDKYDGLRLGPGKRPDGSIFILNRREDNKRHLPNIDYVNEHNVPDLESVVAKLPNDTFLDGEGGVLASEQTNIRCQHLQECLRTFGKCPRMGEICRSLTQRRFSVRDKEEVARRTRQLPIVLVTWDARRIAGQDISQLPTLERLAKLESLVKLINDPHLIFAPYYTDGVELFKRAHEGIVAKRIDKPYVPTREGGSRFEFWIKIKHVGLRICDVQGYCRDAEGRISNTGLRNLVLTHQGRYCGTVGGGFEDADRVKLKAFFDKFPKQTAPWDIRSKVDNDLVYVPNTGLKVQVAYQEIMPSGILYALRCKDIYWPQTAELQPQPITGSCFFWQPP